jgi:hypothetical protein
MSNVVYLPPPKGIVAVSSKNKLTDSAKLDADHQLAEETLIDQIKRSADDLVLAVKELQQDGCQRGSDPDAIGKCLWKLDLLRQLWSSANDGGYDPNDDIPW